MTDGGLVDPGQGSTSFTNPRLPGGVPPVAADVGIPDILPLGADAIPVAAPDWRGGAPVDPAAPADPAAPVDPAADGAADAAADALPDPGQDSVDRP